MKEVENSAFEAENHRWNSFSLWVLGPRDVYAFLMFLFPVRESIEIKIEFCSLRKLNVFKTLFLTVLGESEVFEYRVKIAYF